MEVSVKYHPWLSSQPYPIATKAPWHKITARFFHVLIISLIRKTSVKKHGSFSATHGQKLILGMSTKLNYRKSVPAMICTTGIFLEL